MLRRLAALVAGLALLAACQGKPEVVEPDPTDSPTASPAPTMPAQAREDSQEGRVAFAAHWIDLFNHAQATGDVRALSDASADECDGCQSYIELFRKTYLAGGYFKNADLEAVDFAVDETTDPNVIFVRVIGEPTDYRKDRRASPTTGKSQDHTLVIEVSKTGGPRSVVRLERSN